MQGIAQKEEGQEDIMIEDIEVEVGVEVDNIEVEEDIVIDMIVEVIAEVVIILLAVGIRLLFNYLENKKIKSILDFIDKKSKENQVNNIDRFKECLEIIKQNNKEEA